MSHATLSSTTLLTPSPFPPVEKKKHRAASSLGMPGEFQKRNQCEIHADETQCGQRFRDMTDEIKPNPKPVSKAGGPSELYFLLLKE